MSGEVRCSPRKHVVERGQSMCDCQAILVGRTEAGNALVVTVIDPTQRWALDVMGDKDAA